MKLNIETQLTIVVYLPLKDWLPGFKGERESLWGIVGALLGGFQHAHFNMQASCSRHVNQGIQAEQVNFATHKVRNSWLSYAE